MSFNIKILEEAIAHRRYTQKQERQQILAQVYHWLDTQEFINRSVVVGFVKRDFSRRSHRSSAVRRRKLR